MLCPSGGAWRLPCLCSYFAGGWHTGADGSSKEQLIKNRARTRAEIVLYTVMGRVIGVTLIFAAMLHAVGQTYVGTSNALSATSNTFHSPVQPESFYIASFEDGSWKIVDVQPTSASDTRIRAISVYPACGTYHVRERDYVLANISVADLSQKADLCASQETLSKVIRLLEKKKSQYELWDGRHGSMAQCGTQKIIHQLPARDSLRFDVLEKNAPQLAALWSLASEIKQRIAKEIEDEITSTSLLHKVNHYDRDLASEAAIEIRSGRFDFGLPDLPDHLKIDGKQKVSDLVPAPEEASAPEEDYGIAENVERLGLEKIEPIPYPQMARIAHITGDFAMTVRVDPASGVVVSATSSSGHPILQIAARGAIKNWVFIHPY